MKVFRTLHHQRKKKAPLPFRYIVVISSIIFIILTIQALFIVEKGIRPTLMTIAQVETQRIATLAINDAISRQILNDTDMEDMADIQKDENGNVIAVQYNPVIYNRVLQETTKRVKTYLKDIEQGQVHDSHLPTEVDPERSGVTYSPDGIIHMIPLGQVTNNAFLAHLGPRVPVRFSIIGEVKSQFKENIVHVGINNTYMSIIVDIEVDVRVVIPFATETEVVHTSVPVSMVYIQGDVPDFYGSGREGGMGPGIIYGPKEFEPPDSHE